MKASLFRVTPAEQTSFRCVRVHEKKLGVPWHFHPEYQLTLVVAGTGQRIVGDSIAPVAPGDLTLLGPNVPHAWDVDRVIATRPAAATTRRKHRVDAVVVQFRAEFLGTEFWGVPETAGVVRLLASASRGLEFSARARQRVASDIVGLLKLAGLQRLLGLVAILDSLARDGRGVPICSADYVPELDADDRDRLLPVVRQIHENLSRPLRRGQLAALAGISERTFSRYFRQKMGKTLPQFVNELRIGRARRLLAESELPVTHVAAECGFRNLSNFNSQFRSLTGLTPVRYRADHALATREPRCTT
ncbi:MAG: helix-turn-helix domain-containing protein [Planctomycetia bacterium]